MTEITPESLSGLRRDLGWTQRDLAVKLGVSQPLVARWESGTMPIRDLVRLALRAVFVNAHRRDWEWWDALAGVDGVQPNPEAVKAFRLQLESDAGLEARTFVAWVRANPSMRPSYRELSEWADRLDRSR